MSNIYISSDTDPTGSTQWYGDGRQGHRPFSGDTEIWDGLKNAIAASSGFQRWLLETEVPYQDLRLEQQVQRYLRETLENLAY